MPKEGCTCICLLGMLIDPVFKMEKSNCKYCTANVFRRMQIHCQRKKSSECFLDSSSYDFDKEASEE